MPVKLRVGDLVREKGPELGVVHGEIVEIVAGLYRVQRDDEDRSITTFHPNRVECFQFAPLELEKERDEPNPTLKLASMVASLPGKVDVSEFIKTTEMFRISVLKEALEVVKEADASDYVADRLVHHIEGILRGLEK